MVVCVCKCLLQQKSFFKIKIKWPFLGFPLFRISTFARFLHFYIFANSHFCQIFALLHFAKTLAKVEILKSGHPKNGHPIFYFIF